MLPEIVDAVGDQLTIIFDSGIRGGVDIIKALSLGAKAVFVGRPAIYGLAVAGKVCWMLRIWHMFESNNIPGWSKTGLAGDPGRPRSIYGAFGDCGY